MTFIVVPSPYSFVWIKDLYQFLFECFQELILVFYLKEHVHKMRGAGFEPTKALSH